MNEETVHGPRAGEYNAQQVARGLGWFSIGLGLVEVAAPEQLGEALGMKNRTELIRFYGIREITAGLGLLLSPGTSGALAPWMWARVGGDALDIATLSSANQPENPKKANAGLALAMVAGITLVDVLCAKTLSTST